MNSLVTRSSLFDDFFKDFAPAFYVRPLHGDGLPTPSQIKIDVKEDDAAYTVHAEVPRRAQGGHQRLHRRQRGQPACRGAPA